MTMKEVKRLEIVKEIESSSMSYRQASERLQLSRRQICRLMKRYREEGCKGLRSKHRGRISPKRKDPKIRSQVLHLMENLYHDFGPTFAVEKLNELHQIVLGRETLRQWLIQEGRWRPKKKKEFRIHPRRPRRARRGALVQIDGSYHLWLEVGEIQCCLLVYIDDATSAIMAAKFCHQETVKDYMELTREYIEEHGKPLALYSDKHSVFRVNHQENLGMTQFGRALKELDIELICAHSPQAKGRVERANGTLQDRLVKEMRLRKIGSLEEANQYLKEFIPVYNHKFAKRPGSQEDAHRETQEDLRKILAPHTTRKLDKNLAFQYKNKTYQLSTRMKHRMQYQQVKIIEHWNGPIQVQYRGQDLEYTIFEEQVDLRPPIVDSKQLATRWKNKKPWKPSKRHPWR